MSVLGEFFGLFGEMLDLHLLIKQLLVQVCYIVLAVEQFASDVFVDFFQFLVLEVRLCKLFLVNLSVLQLALFFLLFLFQLAEQLLLLLGRFL